MFTVHSKANDTEYKVWGVDAKLLIYYQTRKLLYNCMCLFVCSPKSNPKTASNSIISSFMPHFETFKLFSSLLSKGAKL